MDLDKKKIRNIGIIVLLVIASYAGVFYWGYSTGTKSGFSGSTKQSEAVEDRIQRTGDYSEQVVTGITGIEEGLEDIAAQVVAARQEVSESREEVKYSSGISDRITERSEIIEGYSKSLSEGSGSINSGFSDIEEAIEQMLRQD